MTQKTTSYRMKAVALTRNVHAVQSVIQSGIKRALTDYPEEYWDREYWVDSTYEGTAVTDNESFINWQEKQLASGDSFLSDLSEQFNQHRLLSITLTSLLAAIDAVIKEFSVSAPTDKLVGMLQKFKNDVDEQRDVHEMEYERMHDKFAELEAALNDLEEVADFEEYEAW